MEGKRTEPFENLDPPMDDVDHIWSITVMARKAVAATTKTSKLAGQLNEDNIDITSWNILVTKAWDP